MLHTGVGFTRSNSAVKGAVLRYRFESTRFLVPIEEEIAFTLNITEQATLNNALDQWKLRRRRMQRLLWVGLCLITESNIAGTSLQARRVVLLGLFS